MKYDRKKQSKNITEDWKYIKRHKDITRGLSKSARFILSSALYQIKKYGHAVLTHDELSLITEAKRRQNCNLVKELGFVLDITFERSIIISDKKYRDCYIFTKNENTDEILENPEEYFANLFDKNCPTSGKKLPDIRQKITRSSEPLYIYNKKEIKKNDNHDYQHNQFLNSKNFSSEYVETGVPKNEAVEFVENSALGVAKEECEGIAQCNTETVEQVEAPIASDYVLGSTTKTVETIGKDGNTYQSPYLRDFRFTKRMIQTAISRSNKKHYTSSRVWVIIRNILEKKPNTAVYGGRLGAINYLVKAIDGENDYEYTNKYPPTQEEKAISMAEISNMKRIQLEKELVKNEIKWF